MAINHRKENKQFPTGQQVAVVMVPLPAQGHLNQLLHLGRLISGHDIPVYYAAASTYLRQAKTRAHKSNPSNIIFHELPSATFKNLPPNPNASTKFPLQIMPSLHASTRLREPVCSLVRELANTYKKVVVIYDSLMSYVVQDIGTSIPNAELFRFVSISAFSICAWDPKEYPGDIELDTLQDLPSIIGYYPSEFSEFLIMQSSIKIVNCGRIYNSNSVIEGPFLDFLGKIGTEKIWGLGPFDLSNQDINDDDDHDHPMIKSKHKCLEWLDKQDPQSVIYVSFGTTTSFLHEQIAEIALGLERSQHKFIWVLRDADRGNIFDGGNVRKLKLPPEFEERIKERGFIVRDWAPQLEILGHIAVGGFMTHCGWNSCLESISNGVAIATWPLHSDQPWNAVLITKVLKIGVMVKKWTSSSCHELVNSFEVEEAVRKLMGDCEIRKRAKDLGDAVKNSVMEGGDINMEINSFISRIKK